MITKTNIQSAILEYAEKLEYDGSNTSHVVYMTIFLAICRDNSILDKEGISRALAIWDSYPKNPSAFKQDVEKWLTSPDETAPSKIAGKYLDKI